MQAQNGGIEVVPRGLPHGHMQQVQRRLLRPINDAGGQSPQLLRQPSIPLFPGRPRPGRWRGRIVRPRILFLQFVGRWTHEVASIQPPGRHCCQIPNARLAQPVRRRRRANTTWARARPANRRPPQLPTTNGPPDLRNSPVTQLGKFSLAPISRQADANHVAIAQLPTRLLLVLHTFPAAPVNMGVGKCGNFQHESFLTRMRRFSLTPHGTLLYQQSEPRLARNADTVRVAKPDTRCG